MIFTPVIISTAGIFCLFNRFCRLNRTENSAETEEDESFTSPRNSSSSSCCCCCCPRIFEDPVRAEDLMIPLRSPNARNYSSINLNYRTEESFGNDTGEIEGQPELTTTRQFDDELLFYRETFGSVESPETETINMEVDADSDTEIYDFQHPLIVDSSIHSQKKLSAAFSPPDLLLKPGPEAVEAYGNYMKTTCEVAQGPEVFVDPNSHSFKSKSTAAASPVGFVFIRKDASPDRQQQLAYLYNDGNPDDFDDEYSKRYEAFLRENNLAGIEEVPRRISAEGTTEKKVSFSSITDVRITK